LYCKEGKLAKGNCLYMACSKRYRYRWNGKYAVLESAYDALYDLDGYYGGRFINHFLNNYFGFGGYSGIFLELVIDSESFAYNFFEPMLFIETEWIKRIGGKRYYLPWIEARVKEICSTLKEWEIPSCVFKPRIKEDENGLEEDTLALNINWLNRRLKVVDDEVIKRSLLYTDIETVFMRLYMTKFRIFLCNDFAIIPVDSIKEKLRVINEQLKGFGITYVQTICNDMYRLYKIEDIYKTHTLLRVYGYV
jgi:hypothetical protein